MDLFGTLRSILETIKREMMKNISDVNTISIVVGAIIAIFISAAMSPIITGFVAHGLNERNISPYESPTPSIQITGGGGYTVQGETLEEFGGVKYNESTSLYELEISSNAEKPIKDLDLRVPLPGCVIAYNTQGVGSEVRVIDYVTLDLKGQREGLDIYSCSKIVSVEQLDPNDSVSVRFLLRVSFDKCDVLLGAGTENIMNLNYQWNRNGIKFFESEKIPMGFGQKFQQTFEDPTRNAVDGKPARVDGVVYTNLIIANGSSFPQAMGRCRLRN